MAQVRSDLKKRAWLAKQRLRMGYFNSLESQGRQDETLSSLDRVAKIVPRYGFDDRQSDAELVDERMYIKVCEILDRDELTINPIGQLIDESVYSTLDAAAKQRYILELSEKFRELKERYYRERTGT